jgi:predicted DNA-binding antitoxin AbrB/MazE fold protein
MVHSFDAIYDHGVFRPTKPLPLPDGTRVHLRGDEGELETREPLS